ncbi:hypothetical protein [Marisediminicola antarctica]|nr:hypothetical protein [Marisediminicola antarctica]
MIITVSTAAGPLEEGPVFRARLEPTNVEVIIDSRDEVLDHDLTRGQPFRWAATGRNLKDGLRQQAARRIVKLEEVVASAQESAEATLGKEDHRLLWQVVRWTNSEHSAIKFLGRLNHDDATGRKFSVVAGE